MQIKQLLFTIFFAASMFSIYAVDDKSEEKERLTGEYLESLSNLSKKIDEQAEIINMVLEKASDLVETYAREQKYILIKKNPNHQFSEQEIEDIKSNLRSELQDFLDNFLRLIRNNEKPEHILLDEYKNNIDQDGRICRGLLKFYGIRMVYEQIVLAQLIMQWEQCSNKINNLIDK